MHSIFRALLVLSLGGCAIVSREHLDRILGDSDAGRRDGDTPDIDSGPEMEFDDVCGEANPRFLLRDTTMNIAINTEGYQNNVPMSCNASTPGNDIFFAVDVQAGEFWHFHLSALTANRQPILYLTTGGCDTRNCTFSSNSCDLEGDEHFAFVADEDTRFYLGVDDEAEGAAEYTLSAFRPVCGDGDRAHGEGCDTSPVEGHDCGSDCRLELTETGNTETEPNDNTIEANTLLLPASNEMIFSGSVGGPGACLYPDVFAISVPANGDLQVDALDAGDTPCTSSALTPYRFNVQNAAGTLTLGTTDGNGCSIFRGTNLPAGRYFIRLDLPAATSVPASYRVRARILP